MSESLKSSAKKKKPPREVDSDYFRRQLEGLDISMRGLAHKWKMDPAQISRIFSGARQSTIDDAMALSALFGRPFFEIVQKLGYRPILRTTAPIAGYFDADGNVAADWGEKGEQVDRPTESAERLVALQMRMMGSKMEFCDGWLAFAAPPNGVAEEVVGKPCIVKVKSKAGQLLRQVRRGYKAGRFNLIAPDMSVQTDVELEYATPITWIRAA